MRIEHLSGSPDRAGRFLLRFEDGETMRLYRQTIEDFGLYTGQELSDAELERLRNAASAFSAKMRAVRIVSASSVSKKDLEQRLIHKGEAPDKAREAVEWMAELDLIDDRKTAQQVVSRCVGKGYGLSRAKQALYEKRIPKQYWDEALSDYPDQTEYIVAFLQAKLDSSHDQKELRKVMDALIRRGHSYSQIRKALELLSLDSDEFPEG